MTKKQLLSLVCLLVLIPALLFASSAEQTHNTVPTSNSTFLTDLSTFLKQEAAETYQDTWDGGFITSGGLHSTGAGLVGAPGSTVGYAGGYYFTETGSITYSNNATCWAVANKDLTGNSGSFTRVSGTHYLLDCVSGASQPSLPSNSTWLMEVTTSGGSITAVTDLRSRVPDLETYLAASLPPAGRRGRMAFARDAAASVPYFDDGSNWHALMTNPMTTAGDLIVGLASGNPSRLAIGTANQILGVNSGATAHEYKTVSVSGGLSITHASNSITLSLLNTAQGLTNLGLAASVSGNVLTIALKDASGSDPSSSSPVGVIFRHTTASTGQLLAASITSALSTSVSAGSSLGFAVSESGRIWVGLQYNSGTPELCEWNSQLSNVGLYRVNEGVLQSSTSEGGAGAADSAGVIYCTTGRSSQPFRVIGYIDIATGNPAGNWSNSPTILQVMGEGVHRTGDLVQYIRSTDSAYATGATTIPEDDTIPAITEGTQFMTVSITPTSGVNHLEIDHLGNYATSTNVDLIAALFQDATTNALAAFSWGRTGGSPVTQPIGVLTYRMAAGTTSSTTFRVRAGLASAGSVYFNGTNGARLYGGVAYSRMEVKEIMR